MAKVEIELRDKLLVTCAEAAAMLSTSEKTMRKLVDQGQIKALLLTQTGSSKPIMKFYVKELHNFCEQASGSEVVV